MIFVTSYRLPFLRFFKMNLCVRTGTGTFGEPLSKSTSPVRKLRKNRKSWEGNGRRGLVYGNGSRETLSRPIAFNAVYGQWTAVQRLSKL